MTIQEVYEIFKEYFGEDRVDLQSYATGSYSNIFVYWPKVTITNELDQSINIEDLYARLKVSDNGVLDCFFELIKSSYTKAQWIAGYSHSHLPRIYHGSSRDITNYVMFQSPCLGGGPIRNTQHLLEELDTADAERWQLFCFELDKYVTVESLSGGPYIKLSEVYLTYDHQLYYRSILSISSGEKLVLNLFLKYLIEQKLLKYSFTEYTYNLGMSKEEALLKISNLFIEWVNKNYVTEQNKYPNLVVLGDSIATYLTQVKYRDGKFYSKNNSSSSSANQLENFNNASLGFRFKGEPVKFKVIEESVNVDDNTYLVLHPKYLEYLTNKILAFINGKYGKEERDSDGRIIRIL